MAPPSPAGMGGPVWVRCTPHALMVLAQEVEAQDDTDAVSGDICTVTSGGELNAEHVLLEPEVHISDLRHLHGERRRFDHFRHRYHPRDGDCGRQEPARAREDRRGRGVVCRGDHHKPVQRSGGEEPLEGARSDTRQRRCGGARELGERITPCGGQLHLLVSLLHLAGVVCKEVPGQALADGMDVDGWRDAVGGFRGVCAAQPGRLAHRIRPQVLVHRVHGDRLQWLDSCHSAVVQQEEGPRLCYHVQPPLDGHGDRSGLLHLR